MNPWLPYLLLALAIAFVALKFIAIRPRMPATAAFSAVQSGHAVLVDVREPGEWERGVATGAALLPLSDLRGLRGLRERWQIFLDQRRDKKLLLYCRSGARSAYAASILRREGFDAVNIGSFSAWRRAGLPVRHQK